MSKEELRKSLTKDELIRWRAASHPGVIPRQGTSPSHPPHVPSLIGIQDIKYLDATGLVRHRSIGDIMRYAVINEGLDTMARFGDFQPSQGPTAFSAEEGTRYSDEQLYALALYLYSLKPPPNPNPFDDQARHGQHVFQQQGCAGCHTPPLYTSNKLTPAQGFKGPEDLLKSENILNVVIGTDHPRPANPPRHPLLQSAVTARRLVPQRLRPRRLGRNARRMARPRPPERRLRPQRLPPRPGPDQRPRIRPEAIAGRQDRPDRLPEDVVMNMRGSGEPG